MLIDRSNHYLFQPLLYQVATSVLSPGQIGWPIREMFKRQPNATVVMGELTGVDKERRRVFVTSLDRRDVPVEYDYLVMATGVRHSYFGHEEFERVRLFLIFGFSGFEGELRGCKSPLRRAG
jgi:NADH dehydrogenase FAD-containing subunit